MLVGHSIGCFNARRLAARWPADVAALVLADPGHEDVNARMPPGYQLARRRVSKTLRRMPMLARLGLFKVLRRLPSPPSMPPGLRLALDEMTARNLRGGLAEVAAQDETYAAARGTRSYGDIPLVIVAAGKTIACFDPKKLPPEDVEPGRAAWLEMLRELAGRSTRGELRVVPDSGHHVPLEKPDAVVQAIRDVVEIVRREAGSANVG